MKQLLQNLKSGETVVAEVPVPSPQPGMVLVQTHASLVSAGTERTLVAFAEKSLLGKARSRPDLVRQALDKARREGLLTTLEAAQARLDQPMSLGYSSAGSIVALGEGVQGFQVGQRVACAGGGYAVHAEYALVPVNLLAALPASVDAEAAAFTTLGAIALHGFRLSEAQLGERVAVIGLGLLGLLAVQIARAAGCLVLGIDLDPQRVGLARDLGIEAVEREQAERTAQSLTGGKGYDAILICADTPSSDPVDLAGALARDRGRVVAIGAVGLEIPRKVYYEKEISFIVSRSYGPGRYDPAYEEAGHDYPLGFVRWTEGRNLAAFVDLLASGRIDVHSLITHRFPIERAPQAYELISGKQAEPYLGVLLTYPQAPPGPVMSAPVIISQRTSTDLQSVQVNLGVLGAGNFANSVLLPAIKKVPQVRLVGVVSASGRSAQYAAQHFGFHYAASSEAQILEDPQVNSVAILTRHNLHSQQVIAALQAGKHVFCEKPLAINLQQLAEIETALDNLQAERKVGLLTVGFNRRFAPLAVRLSSFLGGRREPLVAIYRVNAGYLPPEHWLHDPAIGGGRLVGEGCHFVDFFTFLVGAPPVAVSAQALPDNGQYCQDNFAATFIFPDGSLGILTYLANGDRAFPKERLEVFCASWVAVLDDFRKLELVAAGRRQVNRSRFRQDKGHQAEWEAFAKAVAGGEQPPIPYRHLFTGMRAVFATQEALSSGKQVSIEGSGSYG